MPVLNQSLRSAVLALTIVSTTQAAELVRNPDRYSVNGRFTFAVDAEFTSAIPANNIGPAGTGGVDRLYDDGFVRVDVSGNAGGVTWFWGYNDASQLAGVGTAAGTLSFHSAPSPADQFTLDSDEDVLPGIDFNYARDLGSLDIKVLGQSTKAWYGISFGFGYTDLSLGSRGIVTAPVMLTTDTYAIGALVPPAAPHVGTFAGPGPVIPDTPAARTTAATAATSSHANDVDGRLYGFTVGPFLEIPLSDRLIAEIGGGLAVAHADRRYEFTESVAIAGVPNTIRSGVDESSDWLVGGVFNANLHYRINRRMDGTLGFQYQNLGTTSQSVAGKTAQIGLQQSLGLTFGLNWRF